GNARRHRAERPARRGTRGSRERERVAHRRGPGAPRLARLVRAALAAPAARVTMPTLRLASYNVHRAIGRDRRCEPERILAVLREIDADVLALQEVEAHDDGGDMLAWLATETGFQPVAGTTLMRHDGHYGNGL